MTKWEHLIEGVRPYTIQELNNLLAQQYGEDIWASDYTNDGYIILSYLPLTTAQRYKRVSAFFSRLGLRLQKPTRALQRAYWTDAIMLHAVPDSKHESLIESDAALQALYRRWITTGDKHPLIKYIIGSLRASPLKPVWIEHQKGDQILHVRIGKPRERHSGVVGGDVPGRIYWWLHSVTRNVVAEGNGTVLASEVKRAVDALYSALAWED